MSWLLYVMILLVVDCEKEDDVKWEYLGSMNYSLQPSQSFEHQFFKIDDVKSVDLFFSEAPQRRVEESDLSCYWSFQEMGLEEVNSMALPRSDEERWNDVMCLGGGWCVVRQGNRLILNKHNKLMDSQPLSDTLVQSRLLYVSYLGLIVVYGRHEVESYDVSGGKLIRVNVESELESALMRSGSSGVINHQSQGIFVCSHNLIQIYHVTRHIEYLGSMGDCLSLQTQDEYLYVLHTNRTMTVFDVSDTYDILILPSQLEIEQEVIKLSVYHMHLALLSERNNTFYIALYQLNITNHTILQFNLKLNHTTIGLQVPPSTTQSQINFDLLSKDLAALYYNGTITLANLAKISKLNQHQQLRHTKQPTILTSTHILPSPSSAISLNHPTFMQISQNTLKTYIPTTQSYNLVCTAPPINITKNLPISFQYYGLIRSQSPCNHLANATLPSQTIQQHLNTLLQREEQQSKCIYTFVLNMHVERHSLKWTKPGLIIASLLSFLLVYLAIQALRNHCKWKNIDQTLQKFEQLNHFNVNDTKEKIRITHQDAENEEFE